MGMHPVSFHTDSVRIAHVDFHFERTIFPVHALSRVSILTVLPLHSFKKVATRMDSTDRKAFSKKGLRSSRLVKKVG